MVLSLRVDFMLLATQGISYGLELLCCSGFVEDKKKLAEWSGRGHSRMCRERGQADEQGRKRSVASGQ